MGGVIPPLLPYGFMVLKGKNFKITARYQDLIYTYGAPYGYADGIKLHQHLEIITEVDHSVRND